MSPIEMGAEAVRELSAPPRSATMRLSREQAHGILNAVQDGIGKLADTSPESTVSDSAMLQDAVIEAAGDLVVPVHLQNLLPRHQIRHHSAVLETIERTANEAARQSRARMMLEFEFAQRHWGKAEAICHLLTAQLRDVFPDLAQGKELTFSSMGQDDLAIRVRCEIRGCVTNFGRAWGTYDGIGFAWFMVRDRRDYGCSVVAAPEQMGHPDLDALMTAIFDALHETASEWEEHRLAEGADVPTTALTFPAVPSPAPTSAEGLEERGEAPTADEGGKGL